MFGAAWALPQSSALVDVGVAAAAGEWAGTGWVPALHDSVAVAETAAAGALALSGLWGGALETAVRTATGPAGLVVVAAYSFLIAVVLPFPSEVVLASAQGLELGLPTWFNYVLVILVSGVGKAAGSVVAFHLGQEAKRAGPITRALRRSRFEIVEWSESTVVRLSRQYGYFGLALALSVPGFPDTLSIYAFAVLEEDYAKFALATFAGSVGRLLVTLAAVGGGIALL